MKSISSKFLKSKFLGRVNDIKAVFSLDDIKVLSVVFRKYIRFITVYSTGKTRVTSRLRHFMKFFVMVTRFHRHHGSLFVVKWLKASHTAIQRYISGHPYRSLREIEPDLPLPRLINGLPAFIGSMDRKSIRLGHAPTIRLWLSVLNFYRVLEAPTKPKLNTITDCFGGDSEYIHWACFNIDSHIRRLKGETGFLKMIKISSLRSDHLKISSKGGPNVSPAYRGVLTDSISIFRYGTVAKAFEDYCRVTNSTLFFKLQATYNTASDWWRHSSLGEVIPCPVLYEKDTIFTPKGPKVVNDPYNGDYSDIYPGKLHGIVEPAGKLRIIAIVDIWTQSLLSKLHDNLFDFLRGLPNDGTFDQDLAFHRAKAKAKASGVVYSVDLSAATDRLPIEFQKEILNSFYGADRQVGTYWARLLDRPFIIRDDLSSDIKAGTIVRYGCGQPMGCLSSWAMLAVTHHFILQFCAQNAHGYQHWNTDYEILGDDLIIFDNKIYSEYISLMSKLDVGTNPSKSLVSENGLQVFEFAKRTAIKGIDVSGLSWKQFISTRGLRDRINTILSLGVRGLLERPGLLARLINWNSNPKIRAADEGVQGLLVSLLSHFSQIGMMSYEDAIMYIVDPSKGEEQDFEGRVPSAITLHDILYLISQVMEYRQGSVPDLGNLLISKRDFRSSLVSRELSPYLGNDLIRNTMARVFFYELEYQRIPDSFKLELLSEGSKIFEGKSARDFALYPAYRQLNDVIDMAALSLLYRGGSDQDVFDLTWSYLQRLMKSPELRLALEFRDDIENYISRYTFLKATKSKPIKDLEKHWLLSDISSAGNFPKSSPYWRILQEINRNKVRNPLPNTRAPVVKSGPTPMWRI